MRSCRFFSSPRLIRGFCLTGTPNFDWRDDRDEYTGLDCSDEQIGSGETTPSHQTVWASVDTKSDWQSLVHFLYDVQQPEAFIVFESATIAVDTGDPTKMRGKFKIARWFAPAQRKKG